MGVCKTGTPGELDPYYTVQGYYEYTYVNTFFNDQGGLEFSRSFESELISANSTDFGANTRLAGIKATSNLLVESLLFEWTSALAATAG